MGLGSFIIALFLLGIGLALLIGLAWAIAGPVFNSLRGRKGGSKISRVRKRLERVDELIAENKTEEALKQLRKTVLLDATLNETVLAKLKEHHQNMLSRCLVIAEEMGSRVENLAETEHLLMQRIELQHLLMKASQSYEKLKFRREKAGKDLPTWSKTDYEKRIREINKELRKNESETNDALRRLFDALTSPNQDNIVYH